MQPTTDSENDNIGVYEVTYKSYRSTCLYRERMPFAIIVKRSRQKADLIK